jgi:tRNA dimethylallyltransferase
LVDLSDSLKKLIVVAGPTASGKTELSVELALDMNCPILSADSRQFYKELNIGSAKPSQEEMKGVAHYFIDSHSVQTPISAGQFEKLALNQLNELFQHHNYAILVGGSGMFIDALVNGLDPLPHSPSVREKWNNLHLEKGISFLLAELKKQDPDYYNYVDRSNPVRIIRALEVIELTNKKYADLRHKTVQKRPFETYYFVIDHPREVLYQRINQRVIKMIEKGLIEEAQQLIPFKHLQPLNTVGYKELFHYFEGTFSRNEAIEEIQKNTRRYAKRQITWFKRNKSAHWIPYSNIEEMKKSILEKVNLTE